MHALPRKDRRSTGRPVVDLPIGLRTGGGLLTARTKDVNQHALAVFVPTLPEGLAPGDRVGFSLELQHVTPEGSARLDGTAILLRVDADEELPILALMAEWLMTTPLSGSSAGYGQTLVRQTVNRLKPLLSTLPRWSCAAVQLISRARRGWVWRAGGDSKAQEYRRKRCTLDQGFLLQ